MANDRDCENCKHHKEVCKNGIFYHSCESWDCEFEPKEDEEFEPKEDAISRQAVLEQAMDYGSNTYLIPVNSVKALPPVNPQKPCKDCQYKEWLEGEDLPQKPICPSAGVDCEDCSAYEKKLNKWIPLKTRPMTDEENTFYRDWAEYGAELFDCPLPDDGQEVLVSWGGTVCIDTFVKDDRDGCYFEGVDIGDVEAWMPLPEPYKEEEE